MYPQNIIGGYDIKQITCHECHCKTSISSAFQHDLFKMFWTGFSEGKPSLTERIIWLNEHESAQRVSNVP